MWKTIPGRVKQVPQDSTEWDRTNTGQSTDKTSTRVILILTLVLNPLVISYKKYIYWKLFMRFYWLTSSIVCQLIVWMKNNKKWTKHFLLFWCLIRNFLYFSILNIYDVCLQLQNEIKNINYCFICKYKFD